MPTKKELEEELAGLKQELDALRAGGGDTDDAQGAEADTDDAGTGRKSPVDWALNQLDGTELDRLFKQFVEELDDMHANKPLMTLFGAFVLGYVLGRAR